MARIEVENDPTIRRNTLVEHEPCLREYFAHGIRRG